MANIAENPAVVLQKLTAKKGFTSPLYEIVNSISGTHNNRYDYRVKACGREAMGTGSTKQISKHKAAYNALKLLEEEGIYDPKELPVEEFKVTVSRKQNNLECGSSISENVNCIGPLKNMCDENKIEYPVFKEISDVGPSHSREFTYECCIGSMKTVATSRKKKTAKQLAAKQMVEKFNDILPHLLLEAPKKDDQQPLPSTEKDFDVIERYNKLMTSVVSDKKAKLKDFTQVFHNLMQKFEKSSDVFDLRERTEESLVRVLNQIELKHDLLVIQNESPVIVVLYINCDVSFAVMGLGITVEQAKEDALNETFMLLDDFIQH
ncbi:RISC-loading complex subunit tarbp2-like isoform X2 [Diabrotica undecimpunctata]|uniref:RISC-loading complex subunit tarbp2-like isoform X2 n=1 Tax=Diabrotica undecimpunctata TaxID=50387 RepID=UPI003B63D6B8